MRYLILGDSWGRGEWETRHVISNVQPSGPGWVKEQDETDSWFRLFEVPGTDIGSYLTAMGHDCVNLSKAGADNLSQLDSCSDHLTSDRSFDMILWLHTEPVRSYKRLGRRFYEHHLGDYTGLDKVIDVWYGMIYDKASMLYQTFRIPFFVIGALSPLPTRIQDYGFVKHAIRDWTNDLILDEPFFHPVNPDRFIEFASKYVDVINAERALEETRYVSDWFSMCASHSSFPDNAHPDRYCHEGLAKVVDKLSRRAIMVTY